MRRWRARYEEHGYTGLYDRRTRRPSPQRVPVATVERVLRLYRERYADFNVRHFHEVLQRDHGVGLSYSWVKKALQTAGLVPQVYCPRVLGQWFDGIRFYAAASSPTRSRRTWAGLR